MVRYFSLLRIPAVFRGSVLQILPVLLVPRYMLLGFVRRSIRRVLPVLAAIWADTANIGNMSGFCTLVISTVGCECSQYCKVNNLNAPSVYSEYDVCCDGSICALLCAGQRVLCCEFHREYPYCCTGQVWPYSTFCTARSACSGVVLGYEYCNVLKRWRCEPNSYCLHNQPSSIQSLRQD